MHDHLNIYIEENQAVLSEYFEVFNNQKVRKKKTRRKLTLTLTDRHDMTRGGWNHQNRPEKTKRNRKYNQTGRQIASSSSMAALKTSNLSIITALKTNSLTNTASGETRFGASQKSSSAENTHSMTCLERSILQLPGKAQFMKHWGETLKFITSHLKLGLLQVVTHLTKMCLKLHPIPFPLPRMQKIMAWVSISFTSHARRVNSEHKNACNHQGHQLGYVISDVCQFFQSLGAVVLSVLSGIRKS